MGETHYATPHVSRGGADPYLVPLPKFLQCDHQCFRNQDTPHCATGSGLSPPQAAVICTMVKWGSWRVEILSKAALSWA